MRLAIKIAVLLGAVGVALGLVAWFGYRFYVEWIVSRNPATTPLLETERGRFQLGVYEGGDQVVSPGPPRAPAPAETPAPSAPADRELRPATPTPTRQTPRAALPPTRLRIPRIGVDARIVLADGENLPRFKGIGWHVGTGYPGFRGNMVLFGHVTGPYETLARLGELQPGDDVVVEAMERTYTYRVSESRVVPASAVEVMAPTTDSRATLITCAGTFSPSTREYSHRLVVTALLVEP